MIVWLLFLTCFGWPGPDWGFFGHRTINRVAVYAVPPPLNLFYKAHVGFISEHGVDPDKRRYAIPQEYPRHYFDLDRWIDSTTQKVELSWDLDQEIRRHLQFALVDQSGDTIHLAPEQDSDAIVLRGGSGQEMALDLALSLFDSLFQQDPYDEQWVTDIDGVGAEISKFRLLIQDGFRPHGILPYWLPVMQRRLTQAFLHRDIPKILRLSADLGHYIGDAHVPLHTTENYNGQLTNQHGIHGFWESRVPELFSQEWDMLTGPAAYLEDPQRSAWQWVEESHELVDQVLHTEREVRQALPPDAIMCYEQRGAVNALTQCPEFARAYATALDGMVERRFREAIHAIASAWYTAWIDAGQPDLWQEPMAVGPVEEEKPERVRQTPFGRPHQN